MDMVSALPDDHAHDKCGVVGVYSPQRDAARLAFFGIFALQHRGQESAGIASSDGEQLRLHSDMGLVTQAFREEDLERLTGEIAIGHTRYSTTGSSHHTNVQPIRINGPHGEMAIAHNGNLVNTLELHQRLKDWGCEFQGTTDTEVIALLLANAPGQTWEERISYCMRTLQGAYSLTVATKDTLLGIHDPLAVRPLCLGKLDNGGWVLASESCALDHIGATFLRELEPGETIIIDSSGLRSFTWAGQRRKAQCVFEFIYFSRPDTILNKRLVYTARQAMGAQLAREHPIEGDVVIGIPDSATAAAVGYAQEAGIPYSEGLVKNRYVGRTFIQPSQHLRDLGVRMKFNPLPEVISGKRVIVVDDSIVRGTTTPHVVALLRRAGATEVHLRVCAPPIRHPCYFGVDMATRQELVANGRTEAEIGEFVKADSLGYLSIDGLLKAVEGEPTGYCTACFTGNYPMPVQLEMDKLALERS
jgi:amidophosphoribosyltransferase